MSLRAGHAVNLIVQIAAAIYVLIRGFECALLVLCMLLPYRPAG